MIARNIWMSALCGLTVSSAAALSLGDARGQVLLGRPIDVSFDVHLDPGMDLEAACVAARIVSGETPWGLGQAQVTPLPSVAGRSPAVRVQSFRQADEPVLTIHLAAGCTGTITRTYVLLVDLPEPIAPSATPIVLPRFEPEAPSIAPAGAGAVAASPARAQASPTPPSRNEPLARPQASGGPAQPLSAAPAPVVVGAPPVRQARPALAPASAAKPRPAQPPAPPVSAPTPAGARLVMEPLAVVLTPAAGASAAVALAASSPDGTAPPEQVASVPQPGASDEAQPPQAPKDELASLRMQAANDRAAALALQQRLERIESERFHPGVVYGLLGVLAVMLAWMAWQVLRFRTVFEQSSQAWSESVAMHERKASGQDD